MLHEWAVTKMDSYTGIETVVKTGLTLEEANWFRELSTVRVSYHIIKDQRKTLLPSSNGRAHA